ncbi:TPA: hypothetical protein DCP13_03380 [Candidatus Azambacteria bacterium]|uniref:Pilus assembly protein PilO n=5 Tax=Candidatus Azamiibacteriota TaxID=1752741 RepID=A0A1F5C758_9BACT|nr:MAG: hypothetical protein UX33_C0023G0005 [Candidatus Azambacteria bacterium GW2011_GWC1_46_13]KKU34654.1 MAG: hypothetical protein UX48_C0028G0010 [Candidatus Azambacteria bacterium GW2011_GWB1_46_27]KKU39717.1 MAG: hypothetical protein UX55_C0031G0006 [Candidatus Azambacteria bacterium GW2011_GWE2_46_45]OGD38683.1 MAG: hypothetical protein A3A25_03645 [Candidatus Azambacteria bacterium RIFCSPLOWO2_01_FULL_46_26]HAM95421.1 hypothetical protein [Candidatus Azambacteria bacterium]
MLGLIIRLAIGVSLFFGGIGMLTWYVTPLYRDVLALRGSLAQKQQELIKKEETKVKVKEVLEQYETLAKQAEKVNISVPTGKDIPSLLVTMEALATESGMVMDSLVFGEAAPPAAPEAAVKKYRTLAINVSVRGTYSAFKNYLATIENNVRLLDITNVSFAGVGKEAGTDVMKFSIRMQTYFQ